jgi:hypothetical protein
MRKTIVFTVITMMIIADSALGAGSTINLLDGTINDQSISPESPEFIVGIGQIISGSFVVEAQSNYPSGPIVPMATTTNWGNPQTSYWGIASHVSPGSHTYTIDVSLTAPLDEGTYYIITTMSGVYDYDQLMSGTHAAFSAAWGTGYEVARQSPSMFEEAILYGKVGTDTQNNPTAISFRLYRPDGLLQTEERAMSAIRIEVVTEPATFLLLGLGGLALRRGCRSIETRRPRRVSSHVAAVIVAVSIAGLFGLQPVTALAQTWAPVYQSDFSTDPNWITNDGSLNYWNSSGQAYHVSSYDTGNQYAYVNVSLTPGFSYRLQFDAYITRTDWAGDVRFGLGDPDMNVSAPATLLVGYWDQDFGGQVVGQFYTDSDGGSFHSGGSYVGQFALNTWYHNDFVLSRSANTLTLTVTRVSDGALIGTQTRTGVGGFNNLDRLYMSSIGDTYAPGATGEGLLDNVALYEAVPEPSTLALLALGGVALLGLRRAQRR